MSTENQAYAEQSMILLKNYFTTISCDAINDVIAAYKYNFIDLFHYLKQVDARRSLAKPSFSRISAYRKIFITGRPAEVVTVTDPYLLCEAKLYSEFPVTACVITPRKIKTPVLSVPTSRHSVGVHRSHYHAGTNKTPGSKGRRYTTSHGLS